MGFFVSKPKFIECPSNVISFLFVKFRHCSGEITMSLIIPAIKRSMLLWSWCPQCHFSRWCCSWHFLAFNSFLKCLLWNTTLALLISISSGVIWHGRTCFMAQRVFSVISLQWKWADFSAGATWSSSGVKLKTTSTVSPRLERIIASLLVYVGEVPF